MVKPVNKTPAIGRDANSLVKTIFQEFVDHALAVNDLIKQLGQTGPVTVATLPVVGNLGNRHFVTDATVTTFASIVAGGGANAVPVYDDGTNWRIG